MLVRANFETRSPQLCRIVSGLSSAFPSKCRAGPHHQSSFPASRRLLSTETAVRPWIRPSRSLTTYVPDRRLATAVGDCAAADNIPFDNIPNTSTTHAFYKLRPIDPAKPLMMSDALFMPRIQRISNITGVSGDPEDIIPMFLACLKVGKLPRAAVVLARITTLQAAPPHSLVKLHNMYLEARLAQIEANPDPTIAEGMHKWFELYIADRGLPQTSETIACMLKASILDPQPAKGVMYRRIQRYMEMVQGDSALEVLCQADFLSPDDIATIADCCPSVSELVEEILEDESDQETSTDSTPEDALPSTPTDSVVPEVLPTPQRGSGLRVVKKTLSLFSTLPPGHDISKLSMQERREIQSRLEKDCVDAAMEKWREEHEALLKMGLGTPLRAPSLNSRLYEWQSELEKRLAEEIKKIDASEAKDKKVEEDLQRCTYGPFLRLSTPSRLAAVAILSTINALGAHGLEKGAPISLMLNSIARVVEEDIKAQELAKDSSFGSKYIKTHARRSLRRFRKREPPEAAQPETNAKFDPPSIVDRSWSSAIQVKLAAVLLSNLIDVAKVVVVREDPETKKQVAHIQAAFSRGNFFKRGKRLGVILPNPKLVEMMKREPNDYFLARHLPMVCEPEPWTKFDKGGYLQYPVAMVRIKNGERDQRNYAEAALERGDMEQVTKGLDVLGRTAWRINRPVFDVMLEAWNSGEAIANIPPLNPNIPIPPEPESTEDMLERRAWAKAVKSAENLRSGYHSSRCFMNFQLEIARAYRDQTFYFPHNIDFRGRSYPIPTYLNHMGADHVRGLLTFAKGRELGERGLMWLKVHLSNVYGFDKASLKEREKFAMDNLANIHDSCDKPLTGKRWWLQAEDPWQCLAACYELKAALELPDPTKFLSHLPVHQDGTCNGLQHYAALGGDTWGARQVNLEPGDRPADVYSAVANLVIESMEKDKEDGNELAVALDGKIKRKVVKQTVMTNVYGVTFAGAKKQVRRQLVSLYPDLEKESGIDSFKLSSYIATKIFTGLSSMFRGAHDIQYWLGEIGDRVCRALTVEQWDRVVAQLTDTPRTRAGKPKPKPDAKSFLLEQFKSTIIWTTPLRMPVVQPYRKNQFKVVTTCLQNLVLNKPGTIDPVNRRKQLQAFPPNFIHSLDASHMLLSALECDARGLAFAAVHDSFWTHAADIDVMNAVLRDAFIRIHSENVVGRLADEFKARYKGGIYLAVIDKSTAAAGAINKWRRQNRVGLDKELILEKQRVDLLASGDPEKVKMGKKMKTPTSIYAKMASDHDLVQEDMGSLGLGNIPPASGRHAKLARSAAEKDLSEQGESAEDEDGGGEPASDDPEADGEEHDGAAHAYKARIGTGVRHAKSHISVWLPLIFPKIPKKGDFEIQHLKSSQYFFS